MSILKSTNSGKDQKLTPEILVDVLGLNYTIKSEMFQVFAFNQERFIDGQFIKKENNGEYEASFVMCGMRFCVGISTLGDAKHYVDNWDILAKESSYVNFK